MMYIFAMLTLSFCDTVFMPRYVPALVW